MGMKKLKGIDGKLDTAWAKAVKVKAGMRCEYCGTSRNLNSHHIFSRSKRSTRWLVDNGVCLCVSHHTFSSHFSAHKTPTEFHIWLEEKRGRHFIDRLRVKAAHKFKISDFEKKILLKELNEMCQ